MRRELRSPATMRQVEAASRQPTREPRGYVREDYNGMQTVRLTGTAKLRSVQVTVETRTHHAVPSSFRCALVYNKQFDVPTFASCRFKMQSIRLKVSMTQLLNADRWRLCRQLIIYIYLTDHLKLSDSRVLQCFVMV